MSEEQRVVIALARGWAIHPGLFWVGLTALLFAAAKRGVTADSPLFWLLGALWFATTVQLLRWLWQRSPLLASFVGVGIPALMLVIPLPHARMTATDLAVFFSPAAAAVLAEVLVRRFRLGERLLATPPPSPPREADAPRRVGRSVSAGCVTALLLAGGCVGWMGWKIGEPARHARRARAAIQPGMRLSEVVAPLEGAVVATALGPEDADPRVEPIRIFAFDGRRHLVTIGETERGSALSRAEVVALLEQETAGGSPYRVLALTFSTPGIPPKVSFRVTFDADGRVESISPSRFWD